jgi:hypothetical protein
VKAEEAQELLPEQTTSDATILQPHSPGRIESLGSYIDNRTKRLLIRAVDRNHVDPYMPEKNEHIVVTIAIGVQVAPAPHSETRNGTSRETRHPGLLHTWPNTVHI